MLQFDPGHMKVRSITLGDLKYLMLRLDEVSGYMQSIALEDSKIMESFRVVQMLCIERIADIADGMGFDDINELEYMLVERPYFSVIIEKDETDDE